MDCLRHTTTDRRFCSTAPTRIIPKTGRPSSTALSARSGTPEGSACTRATSICSRTSSKLQRVRAHRRRGRRCRTARRSRPDASRAPGAAPLHQSRPERPARWRAVAVWRPTAVPVGAIWASESFTITGLIVKDLALWEEGQEALMSQGGPSVRQVGVSGSSSSVRARSPTRDAYVSIDPGGTVVFRARPVPGVRRHG